MPDSFLPTLALSAGEIISILIAIGVILSGIFGQANEARKTKEKREARRRGESVGGEQVHAGGLDEIAQRRRQQLEALARQRRGGGAASPQPDNMTTAQSLERAAAKVQYEAREAGKREHEKVNPMLAWGEAGGTAQAGADAARAEMNASRTAKRNEGARRGVDQRLRAKQQAKAQRQAQREAQRQAQLAEQARASRVVHEDVDEPRRAPLSEDGRGTPVADAFVHQSAYDTVAVDRSVPDNVTMPGVDRRPKLADLMKGRSWREVFILKEILEPPLSMREGQGR